MKEATLYWESHYSITRTFRSVKGLIEKPSPKYLSHPIEGRKNIRSPNAMVREWHLFGFCGNLGRFPSLLKSIDVHLPYY